MTCASLSRALLGYQHTLDIRAAPNETPESRSNFDSRFKIARPPVNMSSSMANSRALSAGKRNIRTRYAFHSTTHFSIAENQTLFFLTHVSLVYFNLLRLCLSHLSLLLFLRSLLLLLVFLPPFLSPQLLPRRICSFHVQTSRSCLSTHFNPRTKLPGAQRLRRYS